MEANSYVADFEENISNGAGETTGGGKLVLLVKTGTFDGFLS